MNEGQAKAPQPNEESPKMSAKDILKQLGEGFFEGISSITEPAARELVNFISNLGTKAKELQSKYKDK